MKADLLLSLISISLFFLVGCKGKSSEPNMFDEESSLPVVLPLENIHKAEGEEMLDLEEAIYMPHIARKMER